MIKLNIIPKVVSAALITFFLPIYPAMIAVGILIAIDTITGVIAARRNNETVTSKKFGRSVTKALVYELLVIAAHLCESYLFQGIPFVKLSLAFLASTEFLSVSENFTKITGLNFVQYIKSFMDTKLRGMVKEQTEATREDEQAST